MNEKITLALSTDSVTIKKQITTIFNGVEYPIGDVDSISYINTTDGRNDVQNIVAEPYKSAIFAMWGDSPTVTIEYISSTQ
ncbi:hypothetical protein [Clostridium sp. YIM B02500]|uniref:hypothetical protein n=1 Tax=Clostridium sp. YIM B02500 TaxID=2910681 RepID=UPI001EEF7203|nr:hypothetical protein [Clostridium sp. YIM B02500]